MKLGHILFSLFRVVGVTWVHSPCTFKGSIIPLFRREELYDWPRSVILPFVGLSLSIYKSEILLISFSFLLKTIIEEHFLKVSNFFAFSDVYLYVIPAAIFDRSGRYVVTGSDDRLVKIWSMETAYCLASCRGHEVSLDGL